MPAKRSSTTRKKVEKPLSTEAPREERVKAAQKAEAAPQPDRIQKKAEAKKEADVSSEERVVENSNRVVYTTEPGRPAGPITESVRRKGARTHVDTSGLAGDADNNYHRAYPVWDKEPNQSESHKRWSEDSNENLASAEKDAYKA